LGFRINNKAFYAEEEGRVVVKVKDLKGFSISSIPDGFYFFPITNKDVVAFEGYISSDKEHAGIASVQYSIFRQWWNHTYGALQYAKAMKKAIDFRNKTLKDVEFDEIEDDNTLVNINYFIFVDDMPIENAYRKFREIMKEIEGHTERLLDGEVISSDVLNNETKYTIELLLPLFRNMQFVDVKYTHGKREFGKDITFSEIDKFGIRRNYGVQVKVGDLSGEAGAEIDKIIGQIDDAFSMPYIDTTSREKRYISDLIIAISGRFTDNAEDKIIEKIRKHNIYFFSIDKIQELLTHHMKKKLVQSSVASKS
jgi:hypothetical protein